MAAPGVLGNDTDVDGDSLTVGQVNGVAQRRHRAHAGSGAKVTLNANGSYTYKPNGAFEDLDTGESPPTPSPTGPTTATRCSNAATVTITITASTTRRSRTTTAARPTRTRTSSVAAPGVLGNDTDVDGDSLTVAPGQRRRGERRHASHARLGCQGHPQRRTAPTRTSRTARSSTSTPASRPPTRLPTRPSDGTALSSTATVTITITGVNDPPVAAQPSASVGHHKAAGVDVTLSATDVDGESLTFSIVACTEPRRPWRDRLA